jgi:hypothetical protein
VPELRRLAAAVAAAVVVLAVGGAGSCGPENEKPVVDDDVPHASALPSATVLRASFERHSDLEVAEGLRPQDIQFADAFTGYVLFGGCSQVCLGALFVTYDGGRSWVERKLPFDRAETVSLWMIDAKTIIVAARPAGWYRSTDNGRTFTRGGDGEPGPADYLRGPSVNCVERQQECTRVLLLDGRPATAQPPLAGDLRGAARAPDGTLYAVAVATVGAGSTLTTATSADGGRTWTPLGGQVTAPAAEYVSVSVSPDGKDVWLLASSGSALSVYQLANGGWREVKRDVAITTRVGGTVALGQGVLAVAGGRFSFVYSNGQFLNADRPVNAASVRMLGDGTLMTTTAASDIWLGTGDAAARLWTRVTIDPRWR